ncbi:hypothetical protein [Frigoribacterium salinisoli]
MELLPVAVGALLVGLLAHAALPGRDTRGLLLVPGLTVAVAAGAWVALGWAGLPPGAAWAVTTLLAVGVAVVVPLRLTGRRRRADTELFARLVRS